MRLRNISDVVAGWGREVFLISFSLGFDSWYIQASFSSCSRIPSISVDYSKLHFNRVFQIPKNLFQVFDLFLLSGDLFTYFFHFPTSSQDHGMNTELAWYLNEVLMPSCQNIPVDFFSHRHCPIRLDFF